MKKFRFYLFLFVVVFSLLSRPGGAAAGDSTETVLKVEKGDVVWSSGDQNSQQIYFSTYQPSKKIWSEPVKVTDDAYRNGHPVVDAGKNGTRVLVWTTGTGSNYVIRYALGKGDKWSEPAEIPAQLRENLSPSVVVDQAGAIWVVWSANDGGQDDIYYAKNSGDGWSTPLRVNGANDVPDILPVISLNAKGVPQVTWKGYRHDSYVQLQSTWTGDGWSDEVEVGATSEKTAVGDSSAAGSVLSTKTANNAAVANMPTFIEHPEKAFLRVYKSSIAKEQK